MLIYLVDNPNFTAQAEIQTAVWDTEGREIINTRQGKRKDKIKSDMRDRFIKNAHASENNSLFLYDPDDTALSEVSIVMKTFYFNEWKSLNRAIREIVVLCTLHGYSDVLHGHQKEKKRKASEGMITPYTFLIQHALH